MGRLILCAANNKKEDLSLYLLTNPSTAEDASAVRRLFDSPGDWKDEGDSSLDKLFEFGEWVVTFGSPDAGLHAVDSTTHEDATSGSKRTAVEPGGSNTTAEGPNPTAVLNVAVRSQPFGTDAPLAATREAVNTKDSAASAGAAHPVPSSKGRHAATPTASTIPAPMPVTNTSHNQPSRREPAKVTKKPNVYHLTKGDGWPSDALQKLKMTVKTNWKAGEVQACITRADGKDFKMTKDQELKLVLQGKVEALGQYAICIQKSCKANPVSVKFRTLGVAVDYKIVEFKLGGKDGKTVEIDS
ncbi:LOW QUALITY PROTEIN: uncharacterized protein ColTof4_14468 [Colletotrichum tofieldiae]|nr:LOW QUALITY PROTEIN: uncharacterized protein ColTof4_14468 [Colletotrichum tofieldiae]